MALNERAALLAPYLQQLLYDRQVQDAVRRAVGTTRGAYGRTQGKSARDAVRDKQFQRRLQEAVAAVWELWSALREPPRRHKPGRLLKLIALLLGGAGVLVAINAPARQRALDLLGKKDPNT